MLSESAKVMFEIYRESGYGRRYRAVYFTELDEHNKEAEISRALAGEHVYDGFLQEHMLEEGKRAVAAIVADLNDGRSMDAESLAKKLAPYEG